MCHYCYTGAKIHQSHQCTRIIEPGGVSYTLESVGGVEGATQEMKPLLEHAQKCYQQCVHLERVMSKEELDSNEGQYFPFIVCRRPPASRKPPKESDIHSEDHNSTRPPDSIENAAVTSPSTIAPVSTSLMSFDGTIASVINNSRHSTAGCNTKVDNRTVPCVSESQRVSKSQCGQEARNQQSELIDKQVLRQDSTSQVIKSVFVQGVGWASQLSSGEVWVQYNDGSQMIIQSSVTSIKYTDSNGTITRYSHADRLPEPIKEKLCHLPVIIENLAALPKISESTS